MKTVDLYCKDCRTVKPCRVPAGAVMQRICNTCGLCFMVPSNPVLTAAEMNALDQPVEGMASQVSPSGAFETPSAASAYLPEEQQAIAALVGTEMPTVTFVSPPCISSAAATKDGNGGAPCVDAQVPAGGRGTPDLLTDEGCDALPNPHHDKGMPRAIAPLRTVTALRAQLARGAASYDQLLTSWNESQTEVRKLRAEIEALNSVSNSIECDACGERMIEATCSECSSEQRAFEAEALRADTAEETVRCLKIDLGHMLKRLESQRVQRWHDTYNSALGVVTDGADVERTHWLACRQAERVHGPLEPAPQPKTNGAAHHAGVATNAEATTPGV